MWDRRAAAPPSLPKVNNPHVMHERSDRDLLLLTYRGDRRAAAMLYARFAPRLTLFARSVLHDEFLAADVVQSVFVKLLDLRRRDIGRIDDALAWLIRSTRNEALNLIRTDRRARARASRHAEISAALALPPGGMDQQALLEQIDRLPEDQRELLVLKNLVGLTFDQLAESLGENRSTLASRYRVALGALRERMSNLQERPGQSQSKQEHGPLSRHPAVTASTAHSPSATQPQTGTRRQGGAP